MKKILPILILCLALACKKDKTATDKDLVDDRESIVQIETSHGSMYMWLYKETALHRTNFLKIANEGLLNNTTFHRNIADFVIQGGDPNSLDNDKTNDGKGGPGYTIPAEILDTFVHIRGAVGAARQPDNVNPSRASNGSQFYITLQKNANTTSLDGKYTVFGMIVKGMDVADKIVVQAKDGNGRPITDIPMTVTVLRKTKQEVLDEFGITVD